MAGKERMTKGQKPSRTWNPKWFMSALDLPGAAASWNSEPTYPPNKEEQSNSYWKQDWLIVGPS